MEKLAFKNIFDAIENDEGEAANLKFRADLMSALRQFFESWKWDQAQIMKKLEIPQLRAHELVTGKVTKITSDQLIGYLAKLGYCLEPRYRKQTTWNKLPLTCSVATTSRAV